MKFLFKRLLIVIFVLLVGSLYFWDGTAPEMSWTPPSAIGAETSVPMEFVDQGRGLRSLRISLRQGDRLQLLHEQDFPIVWFPWRRGADAVGWILETSTLKQQGFEEGPVELVVTATDQPNFGLFSRRLEATHELQFDTTPPRVSPLSRQHYIRQGGSEAVLYRVSEPGTSGVSVGDKEFTGYPVGGQPEGTHIALFALAWDDPVESRIRLWAEDAAGNRTTSNFWHRIQPREFRQRTIDVTDSFIEQVAPDILAHSDLEPGSSPQETFVAVNATLRGINNSTIAELTSTSADRLLWSTSFLQLSNSQVEAHFADRRAYRYQGEIIDHQTHLGFDLASTAQSPIEASNAGRVAFADYLGIYGNCLLIDHGLGLFSLYAHLSSFAVAVGDSVTRGQTIGHSGETGLAAGDHLHFSMVLQGVQVNPVEWWDAQWVENHVLSKLAQPES